MKAVWRAYIHSCCSSFDSPFYLSSSMELHYVFQTEKWPFHLLPLSRSQWKSSNCISHSDQKMSTVTAEPPVFAIAIHLCSRSSMHLLSGRDLPASLARSERWSMSRVSERDQLRSGARRIGMHCHVLRTNTVYLSQEQASLLTGRRSYYYYYDQSSVIDCVGAFFFLFSMRLAV